MQYIYCENSGTNSLVLNTKEYAHIFKVRRVKSGETLMFRNLKDDILYRYRLETVDRRVATLKLLDSQVLRVESKKALHLGWCMVDPKTIEKTLPFLNELGVFKISFVYCEFSQKNFKIDVDRLNRILINSNQQCGRSSLMQVEILENIKEFLTLYPKSKILDFSQNSIKKSDDFTTILVGCEGGFSQNEREIMDENSIIGLDTQLILRSETAVLCAAVLNS